jgi:hypothetical protein
MESLCSSETSVDIQRNTRRYIPEDNTLHNHRCENLKSYTISVIVWFILKNKYELLSYSPVNKINKRSLI